MKSSEFIKTLRGTPVYCAFFEVTNVPEWAEKYVKKGDLVYWAGGTLVVYNTNANIGLGPSYVKFIAYKEMS